DYYCQVWDDNSKYAVLF
nr:immunoglobulin light chain junction region [Macaca mulatta]MOW71014.1 immunoglobulin light chain junction region [Macaca mulatta]MOW71278.1 immunoglobulin light chain junction region [Macaca mulatta]